MCDITMGVIEGRFADIIWQNEPISSTELWKQSEQLFGWKKSTTFTVLKRLCEKGLFKNEKGCVTSAISRQEYYSSQSERFVEETFQGSLPAFLAAFTKSKSLKPEEVEELRKIVEKYTDK